MVRHYTNTAVQGTLTAPIDDTDTTLSLDSVEGWPDATPFAVTLDLGTASEEVVLVTAVSGTTLTVTRGYDSTAAISHPLATTVTHTAIAADFADGANHRDASSGVHGVTGSVVGTTDTQTLSNKTLASPTVTGTATAAAVAASGNVSVGGTLAVTGTSTLTGNVSTAGTLSVTGASTLTGNVSAAGTLAVTGALTAGSGAVRGIQHYEGVQTTSGQGGVTIDITSYGIPAGTYPVVSVWNAEPDSGSDILITLLKVTNTSISVHASSRSTGDAKVNTLIRLGAATIW